jgi:hypothetical protein
LRTPASIVVIPVPLEIVVEESNETGDVAGAHCGLSHRITVHWNARAEKILPFRDNVSQRKCGQARLVR